MLRDPIYDSAGRPERPRPVWPPMFVGVADVKDAFHRLVMPPELSPHFCFEAVGVDALVFIPDSVEGGQARAGSVVFPCARELPMGFTWSLFFCQSVGRHMMSRAAELGERVAAGLGRAVEKFESRGLVIHESGVYDDRC